MKSKYLNFKQILKLHLLKSKIYENGSVNEITTDSVLNQVLVNFKKTLQVIFQYHIQDKKILFIGAPRKLELRINKFTHHSAVPDYFEITGVLSNNFDNRSVGKKSKHGSTKLLFPKLTRKPDLIVIISHKKIENFLKECFVSKIPFIDFVNDDGLRDIWSIYSYKLNLGNQGIQATRNKNLLFIGLNFLFKIDNQKRRKKL